MITKLEYNLKCFKVYIYIDIVYKLNMSFHPSRFFSKLNMHTRYLFFIIK